MASPRVIKFKKLERLLGKYGIKRLPGGKHPIFASPDGRKYPIPYNHEVFRVYIDGARRRFNLTPEHGVSDDDFFAET